MQFTTRLLAAMSVPAGGASVSASTGAHTTAITVTIPSADYFMTEEGGLDGLLATFQTQLNNNVQGYPLSADAMKAATGGFGTWSAGWLFNITSGNDSGAFGGVTLTAVSSPTYSNAGPRGGIDLAVGFDSIADAFDGGTGVFDVGVGADLIGAFVLYFDSVAGNVDVWGKDNGTTGYILVREATALALYVRDGADTVRVEASVEAGVYYVCMLALERGTNQVRIATRALSGGPVFLNAASSTTLVGALTNATNYTVGDQGTYRAGTMRMAACYVGVGVGAASGAVANLSAALTNFANAVNASWSATMSLTDGRITVANSFWPSSVSFTNTTLRDVMGFESNFDYPQTAAQVTAALGGLGDFTDGAGYLCNESSGDLASVFGTPATLTAFDTPAYSREGPRGGNDKAVEFNSANDAFRGGDYLNVTASDDAIFVWVAKLSTLTVGQFHRIAIKTPFANGFYQIVSNGTTFTLEGADVSGNAFNPQALNATHFDEWHVGIATIDRGAATARIATQGLRSGTQAISASFGIASVGTLLNAANFNLGSYTDGTMQIAAFYAVTGPGVATGLSTNLSTALSNFATYMKSQTGTEQCRGVYFPDSTIFVADSDPRLAPVGSDARTAVSGSGARITHVGVYHRIHRMVSWPHVPLDRIREQSATYANASFRTFWDDTQLARGSISWFQPGSSLLIVDEEGNVLGQDMQDGGPTEGWGVVNPRLVEPKRNDANGWPGRWTITIPELVAKDE